MPLREQQSLNELTRHIDDEKQDRAQEVRELPGNARLGQEVVMDDELYKWVGRWVKVPIEEITNA